MHWSYRSCVIIDGYMKWNWTSESYGKIINGLVQERHNSIANAPIDITEYLTGCGTRVGSPPVSKNDDTWNENLACTLITVMKAWLVIKYRKISNTRRTKSQNLNVSRVGLQLSLRNTCILKPSVKWRMKMQLEQRRQAMLQLNLSDQ